MEFIRGICNIKLKHRGCVLTIGNFDGVHLGHQRVLSKLSKQARILNLPSVVMTFEPQPLELLSRYQSPPRLTRFRDKFIQLGKFKPTRLLCLKFNNYFANLSADAFISELLVIKLGVKYLVLGDDFCFGRGRTGDFSLLKAAGDKYGFKVAGTKSLCFEGSRVSSTAIRNALANGRLADANRMLGRRYSISGRVSHGKKLGRTIGYPTANIPLKRCVSPLSGVYVVEALGFGEQRFDGVANIGQRPTVNGVNQQLEVHLFNFHSNFYGSQLEVFLLHKLRDEKKFESFDLLKKQIKLDAEAAKLWLSQFKK
ncbi:riboflavin biosynthesis protein ribF [Candidatus Photodesmus blepharus]|uniref:Riboflavin biosynthesis protein n=1 Tax=Candidatus Photodesmus blepharonis TaxID=1179155 RepID=A0A084CMI4_9GAMM|nr:bifunctional riboflavin kinase/FAD synthetase [Candidatus Photodesmus blepharus]KEY91013.1 riboflavin biosynthesis protein ribF [Candidatus Photodesmus blepharus]